MTELGAWRDVTRNLIVTEGDARPVQVAEITPSAFRVADGTPLMGRVLMEADERPGAPSVAVIGYDVWRTRFGSDPAVLGRSVQLGTEHVTRRRRDARGFRVPDRARCVDASAHRQRRACAAVRAGDLRVRPARARRDPRHGAGGADGGRAACRERAARHPRAASAACRALRDAGRGPRARRHRHPRVDLFLRRDAPRPDLQQRRAACSSRAPRRARASSPCARRWAPAAAGSWRRCLRRRSSSAVSPALVGLRRPMSCCRTGDSPSSR